MKAFAKNLPDSIISQIFAVENESSARQSDTTHTKSISENGIIFFIEHDENKNIAAFCSANTLSSDWEIYDVETAPSYRRKGMAKKLMSALIKAARGGGGERILLEVRESNDAAINLYRALGFKEYSVRKNYYMDNSENALCMELKL